MLEILIQLLLIGLGLAMLIVGSDALVRGASNLARRLGVSQFIIGLTVVAFGTSAPELVVGVRGALGDAPGLVIGNVVGSNTANIGLILGLTAVIVPIACRSTFIRREVALMVAVSLLLYALMVFGGGVSRADGVLLLAGFVAFNLISYLRGRREAKDLFAHAVEVEAESLEAGPTPRRFGAALDFAMFLGGLVILILGGELVVDNAIKLATAWGVSDRVIGISIVAVGTSLPELAASLAAVRRRHFDMILGNVVGSNIFNILLIIGVSSVVSPLLVEPRALWLDMPVMVATAVACLPIMATGGRITRLEGAVLLVAYVGYLAAAYLLN